MIAWLAMALAAPDPQAVQEAELDRVRGEIANQVQLAAFDLVDELAVGWIRDPVFETPTPVVLADVTVPVGLGTGLEAQIENHLAGVLTHNPASNMQLVHCPQCTAVVVHSGPEGTVVSRGIDDPETLEKVGGASGKHALFVDIEAEGAWLVLRARITRLTPDLPIVWSHTVATSASTPALLRESSNLKTAEQAREEYIQTLRGRGRVTVPVRAVVRTYARPTGQQGVAPPPFIWLQSGAEVGFTETKAWTTSLLLGYSFIPEAYQGLMLQSRMSRLLTGRSRSLTRPDLYGFVGGALITVWGPATTPFQLDAVGADEIIAAFLGQGPRYTFGAIHFGLDLRLGNRIGISAFLEHEPSLRRSNNLGAYTRLLGTDWDSFGTEVTVCF
ncbi:MAG: hypothetical protein H6736_18810 [Alphaproteobacteria bacterium]|nr:hypothetical protein [Alphaproteobacteria bacterium]